MSDIQKQRDCKDEADSSEWYSGGLRFECTQCGNCCTGPPGVVRFSIAEGAAMARALGLPEKEFRDRYVRSVGGKPSLCEQESEHGFDCIFLDRTTRPGRALCRVYQARPTQCQTWPFWPELLSSQRAWESARHNTPCPGINRGEVIPIEHIRIQRDESTAASGQSE